MRACLHAAWAWPAPAHQPTLPSCQQVRIRDTDGRHIMHAAAHSGRVAILSQLAAAGAAGLLDAPNSVQRETPLGSAVEGLTMALNCCDDAQQPRAICARYLECMQFLLARGANPNATWTAERATPLLFACQGSAWGPLPEVVAVLLAAGADPEQADAAGRTPLVITCRAAAVSSQARRAEHRRVVELLSETITARREAR